METPRIINETLGVAANVGRFVLSRSSAWADFGDAYGEALGGYERHPASIQFLSTDELAEAA